MLFSNIAILDENLEFKPNMYVAIEGEKIKSIDSVRPEGDFERVYDGSGKLLMSGFYNAHTHSPMTLLRGYGENMQLQDWLEKRIFPFEDKLTSEAVYAGTMLAMAESIRFGIVSSTDMYYFCEDIARTVIKTGAKMNIGRGITNFGESGLYELESFAETKKLIETLHNKENERIKIDLSIHGEYTSNERTVREMGEYVKETGLNMHIHVSETAKEHEECIARRGKTPIEYFADCGVLDTHATAAHCVFVTENDREIMKDKGVSVACNPVSNLKLASGVCNVPELIDKGINVAIGTDGVASNNSLNFLEEIKYFALLSKEKFSNPTLITPVQAIYAATRAGAISQGRMDCGLVKEGFRADLIVIDTKKPNYHPVHDMLTNLVYSSAGSDIELTMVDGKVLYENGDYKNLDISEVIEDADRAVKEILKKL
ncbi:MAG: amidohydrolase [Eubacteriales bacterium]